MQGQARQKDSEDTAPDPWPLTPAINLNKPMTKLTHFDDSGAACDEVEPHNSQGNPDRRTKMADMMSMMAPADAAAETRSQAAPTLRRRLRERRVEAAAREWLTAAAD